MNISDDDDVERLSIAIARALQQARSVSDSEHYDHHVWITEQIARERAARKFWEALRDHVIKWGAISIVSTTGYAFYLGFKALLKAA